MVARNSFVKLAIGLLCAGSIAGCNLESSSAKPSALERSCTSDNDCGDGEFCTRIWPIGYEDQEISFCSKPCQTDADCATRNPYFVCGILDDNTRGCTYHCGASGIACVNGVPTACVAAGDAYCDECTCPQSLTCQSGVGCVEKQPFGGPCIYDDNCVSNNCSPTAKVCRVAGGSTCTTENCDMCLTYPGTSWSFCSRKCDYSTGQCGDSGVCLTTGTNSRCYASCSGCPASCGHTTSDYVDGSMSLSYCDI
jgi:hypothetical protein